MWSQVASSIPAQHQQQQYAAGPAMSSVVPSNRPGFPAGLRVLLVDTAATSRAEAERQLKSCAYSVTSCASASEALQRMHQALLKFEVLLVDAKALMARSKEAATLRAAASSVPLVLMSQEPRQSDVMAGIRMGAVDFLDKPLALAKLRTIWQHIVRRTMGPGAAAAAAGAAGGKAAPGAAEVGPNRPGSVPLAGPSAPSISPALPPLQSLQLVPHPHHPTAVAGDKEQLESSTTDAGSATRTAELSGFKMPGGETDCEGEQTSGVRCVPSRLNNMQRHASPGTSGRPLPDSMAAAAAAAHQRLVSTDSVHSSASVAALPAGAQQDSSSLAGQPRSAAAIGLPASSTPLPPLGTEIVWGLPTREAPLPAPAPAQSMMPGWPTPPLMPWSKQAPGSTAFTAAMPAAPVWPPMSAAPARDAAAAAPGGTSTSCASEASSSTAAAVRSDPGPPGPAGAAAAAANHPGLIPTPGLPAGGGKGDTAGGGAPVISSTSNLRTTRRTARLANVAAASSKEPRCAEKAVPGSARVLEGNGSQLVASRAATAPMVPPPLPLPQALPYPTYGGWQMPRPPHFAAAAPPFMWPRPPSMPSAFAGAGWQMDACMAAPAAANNDETLASASGLAAMPPAPACAAKAAAAPGGNSTFDTLDLSDMTHWAQSCESPPLGLNLDKGAALQQQLETVADCQS